MPARFCYVVDCGAFFMENLDGAVIATVLPQMAKRFHASATSRNIGRTAYPLTLAVLIPISGWVTDRFGSRTVLATAVGIVTVASLLCAASHTLAQFTRMRILQGVGGAMMVPVGRLIVLRETPKDQLAQAIAYISWPGLTALVPWPPLSGFITTDARWHWIFLIAEAESALAQCGSMECSRRMWLHRYGCGNLRKIPPLFSVSTMRTTYGTA